MVRTVRVLGQVYPIASQSYVHRWCHCKDQVRAYSVTATPNHSRMTGNPEV